MNDNYQILFKKIVQGCAKTLLAPYDYMKVLNSLERGECYDSVPKKEM
jgi:hypothetical protein